MQTKKVISNEFEVIATLKILAQAYEQISVMRIQRVRGSVLTTRDFLRGLSDVYKDVKISYKQEVEKLMKHSKKGKISLSGNVKNGKTISILLSSNNKLYGDIISRVFNLFAQDLKRNPTEIAVVGRVGKGMIESAGITLPCTFFEIPDQSAKLQDLLPVFNFAAKYEKILVYYGRFLNIISQEPAVSEISGEESLIDQPLTPGEKADKTPFFFEPNLSKILGFFEDQVFASILKQTVDESELSRLASRIKSMEDSLGVIEKQEVLLKKMAARGKRLEENNKQIQRLSSVVLWERGGR